MCLVYQEPQVADRDITVYKVLERREGELYMPFGRDQRGVSGYSTFLETPADPIFKRKAVGFNEGFGYHCFMSKRNAEWYLQYLQNQRRMIALVIVSCLIPKGTLFAKGRIEKGYIGKGRMAARCTYLRKKEEK